MKFVALSTFRWIGARGFSGSPARFSLYTEYLDKVRPTVQGMTVEEVDAVFREDVTRLTGPRDSFHVFDVREPIEWNEERLPYAKYLGRGKLETTIEWIVPNANEDILLYCSNGQRSVLAAESLQRMGYLNAKYLIGGIRGWKASNKGIQRNMRTTW